MDRIAPSRRVNAVEVVGIVRVGLRQEESGDKNAPLLGPAQFTGGGVTAAAFFAGRSVREALFQAASLSGSRLYLFWMAASRRVTMAWA